MRKRTKGRPHLQMPPRLLMLGPGCPLFFRAGFSVLGAEARRRGTAWEGISFRVISPKRESVFLLGTSSPWPSVPPCSSLFRYSSRSSAGRAPQPRAWYRRKSSDTSISCLGGLSPSVPFSGEPVLTPLPCRLDEGSSWTLKRLEAMAKGTLVLWTGGGSRGT